MVSITRDEYQALMARSGRQPANTARKLLKYRNQPTTVDGIRFDSQREAERYRVLDTMQRAKQIQGLRVHHPFPLVVTDQQGFAHRVANYEADFVYHTAAGQRVVEDVKSPTTRKDKCYRLKKKLFEVLHRITVTEILR